MNGWRRVLHPVWKLVLHLAPIAKTHLGRVGLHFGRIALPWMVTDPATPAALAKPARATG